MTGSTHCTFNSDTLFKKGSWDLFVTSYDNGGKIRWIRQAEGAVTGYGIATDAIGSNIAVAGIFQGITAIFGPYSVNKTGTLSMFVAKLSTTASIGHPSLDKHIGLYPNPANESVMIRTTGGASFVPLSMIFPASS